MAIPNPLPPRPKIDISLGLTPSVTNSQTQSQPFEYHLQEPNTTKVADYNMMVKSERSWNNLDADSAS